MLYEVITHRYQDRAEILTATNISFTAPDKINDAGNRFVKGVAATQWRIGDRIRVTGSALNDGIYVIIGSASNGQLQVGPVAGQSGDPITGEPAGATVSISSSMGGWNLVTPWKNA